MHKSSSPASLYKSVLPSWEPFRPTCTASRLCHDLFGQQRRLVLDAAEFQHITGAVSETSKHYAGSALALLSESRRGQVLQEVCKRALAETYTNCIIKDASPSSVCANGRRRSTRHAEWDFTLDGKKVECKSAQMSFDTRRRIWSAAFHGVKLAYPGFRTRPPFDELYLTMFSPDSLHIVRHDLQTYVSRKGLRTGCVGHQIVVSGKTGDACWRSARTNILAKLLGDKSACALVSHIKLSDPTYQSFMVQLVEDGTAGADHVFAGTPLCTFSGSLRGLRVQEIALEVDRMLHPRSVFHSDSDGLAKPRPPGVDWIRDDQRVEVKAGKMCFSESRQTWYCQFSRIKFAMTGVREHDCFDELWLGIYSPFGIHFWKYGSDANIHSTAGVRTAACGHNIWISAPSHEVDASQALCHIVAKLKLAGCQLLAEVLWDTKWKGESPA
ncbi:unnamed protein product [Effrenium voratum]|nr:unnamed protein product [Effrenium voratum]